ncbi:MAG: hypothetical protein GWN58_54495, partial [Anaerolineae bacterium]|nr:hypothetical protein [Anaerolineae bacterium]
IGSDYSPAAFWKEVLEPLGKAVGDVTTAPLLKQAAECGYARRSLERLFASLGERGRKLVLMLDEFESLLGHPNFQEPGFFGLLRSLATRTGALVLITASRL